MSNQRQFVRQTAAALMAFTSLLPGFAGYCAHAADTVLRQRPNVIVIMADDLGYECLGCNGGASYQTPRLDQLARTGVRFTHCFVNPLCTPTRAALMTGRYNFRNYERFGSLPEREFTFGHMMQDAGYATCIVGKWQLEGEGGTTPDRAVFDDYYMYSGSGSHHADPDMPDNDWEHVQHKEGEYGPKLAVDYLCDFLDRHRKKPFFAYYPLPIIKEKRKDQ
jgi:arylsulfatase A